MEYTVLQTTEDSETVFDAFSALELGRSELTGVAHVQGWTTVRLNRQLAARFAHLLAGLGGGVLVWTVDSDHCRVTLFRANGEVVEALDRAAQVDELTKAFRADNLLVPSGGDDEKAELAAAATDLARPPRHRHLALAKLLGVPDAIPGSLHPSVATPSRSGEERFRRLQRIRSARGWLHFASGIGAVVIVGLVLRAPGYGIPVVLIVIGVMQLVRYWLGRYLPG